MSQPWKRRTAIGLTVAALASPLVLGAAQIVSSEIGRSNSTSKIVTDETPSIHFQLQSRPTDGIYSLPQPVDLGGVVNGLGLNDEVMLMAHPLGSRYLYTLGQCALGPGHSWYCGGIQVGRFNCDVRTFTVFAVIANRVLQRNLFPLYEGKKTLNNQPSWRSYDYINVELQNPTACPQKS